MNKKAEMNPVSVKIQSAISHKKSANALVNSVQTGELLTR